MIIPTFEMWLKTKGVYSSCVQNVYYCEGWLINESNLYELYKEEIDQLK